MDRGVQPLRRRTYLFLRDQWSLNLVRLGGNCGEGEQNRSRRENKRRTRRRDWGIGMAGRNWKREMEEKKKREREQVTAGDPSTFTSRTLSVYFLSPNQPCRYS